MPNSDNPWTRYVSSFVSAVEQGKTIGQPPLILPKPPAANAPRALFFAPHPDDEAISGALAFRLLQERGFHVINVAVTLGSNLERRNVRLEELRHACAYAGFGLEVPDPELMQHIHTSERDQQPIRWGEKVGLVRGLIEKHRPSVIFFPHEADWNRSHIGTHWLVRDALGLLGKSFSVDLIETEFWGQMNTPNLLVEVPPSILAAQLGALSFHKGEIDRNPFHLTLPGWMIDNVRRGAELVGGQGGAAPSFLFGAIYRWSRWEGGMIEEINPPKPFLTAQDTLPFGG